MSKSSASWARGGFKGSSRGGVSKSSLNSGGKVASPHGLTYAQAALSGAVKSTPKGSK
jgi:hypothetical protein